MTSEPAVEPPAEELGPPLEGEIRLYGHEDCRQCKLSVKAMERKGITYRYFDTVRDPAARLRVALLGYLAVPVMETAHRHWQGFIPDNINTLASPQGSDQEPTTDARAER